MKESWCSSNKTTLNRLSTGSLPAVRKVFVVTSNCAMQKTCRQIALLLELVHSQQGIMAVEGKASDPGIPLLPVSDWPPP